MAHPNIDERRYFVARLLNRGIEINPDLKRKISDKFYCHVSAIYSDLSHFKRHGWHGEIKSFESKNNTEQNELLEKECWIITPEQFRQQLIQYSFDFRLIQYFEKNPDQLYSLTPRQFEEFTAELLDKFGYNITLGPKGADGGIDIYAERQNDIGFELMLVQCKRFHKTKKVSRPIIQQLNANVGHPHNVGQM